MPSTSLQVFQTGFLFRHEELFSKDLAGPESRQSVGKIVWV